MSQYSAQMPVILPQNYSLVSTQDYQALINRKDILEQEVITLKGNADQLRQINDDHRESLIDREKEIDRLRIENELLKKKIDDLTKELENVKAQLVTCLLENKEYKVKIEKLESYCQSIEKELENVKAQLATSLLENKKYIAKIEKLESYCQSIENEKLIDKLICALQDLNGPSRLLECLIPAFQDLRSDRLELCHYLNNRDSQKLIDYKRALILQQLERLSPNITDEFSKLYDDTLIPETIKYLHNNNVPVSSSLTQKEKDRALRFWKT